VVSGHYDKADAFLASVPEYSEFRGPVLLWRLKSAVLRGDTSMVSSCAERLLKSMSVNELLEWMEMIRSSRIFKDKILLPAEDARLLKALEEQAQISFEVPKAQGINPMTAPVPAILSGLAPSPSIP